MIELKIKIVKEILGPEWKIKSFKGHLTLYKKIDENIIIKITNISKMHQTVTICISEKRDDTYAQINYIKTNVLYGDMNNTIEEMLKNMKSKEGEEINK